MASDLFRSKQYRSRGSLNKLSISSPIVNTEFTSPFITTNVNTMLLSREVPRARRSSRRSVGDIDLFVKYDFNAENSEELTVQTHEIVKLLDRIGDGWLKVQSSKSGSVGLIPASYVGISVNDLIKPVTVGWLNEVVPASFSEETSVGDDLFDFEKMPGLQQRKCDVYPQTVRVATVLQRLENFWYRVDITMSNGDKVYLGKQYQDFYNLHVDLASLNLPNLPKLPQPHNRKTKDRKYLENLLTRCTELNVYLNKLVKVSEYQTCANLYNWVYSAKGCRLVNPLVHQAGYINEALVPASVDLLESLVAQSYSEKVGLTIEVGSPTAARTNNRMVNSPSDTTLFSFGSLIDRYDDKDPRDRENSSSSDSQESIFSKTPDVSCSVKDPTLSPPTPATPTFCKFENPFVKIKVFLNNKENDIVVLKIHKEALKSITDLKRLVSKKIYQDSTLTDHYRLSHEGEDNSTRVLDLVKMSDKVTLHLIRNRTST